MTKVEDARLAANLRGLATAMEIDNSGFRHNAKTVRAAAARIAGGETADVVLADYVIWSNEHRMWWAPGRMGYTPRLERAGRYARAEAIGIAQRATFGWREGAPPNEIAIAEADAIASLTPPT